MLVIQFHVLQKRSKPLSTPFLPCVHRQLSRQECGRKELSKLLVCIRSIRPPVKTPWIVFAENIGAVSPQDGLIHPQHVAQSVKPAFRVPSNIFELPTSIFLIVSHHGEKVGCNKPKTPENETALRCLSCSIIIISRYNGYTSIYIHHLYILQYFYLCNFGYPSHQQLYHIFHQATS